MARTRVIEAVMETTMQPTHLSTELSTLVGEFATVAALYGAKTVWQSGFDRPYRALLAAAEATVALGEMLLNATPTASNHVDNPHLARARQLVTECLYLPAGERRCLRMSDQHMAAVIALVGLAYRGYLAGDGESLAEARRAVAKLDAMGRRRG